MLDLTKYTTTLESLVLVALASTHLETLSTTRYMKNHEKQEMDP